MKDKLNFSTDQCLKAGSDPRDTWIKMLQSLGGITLSVAEAIVGTCPTIHHGWEFFKTRDKQDFVSYLQDAEVQSLKYESKGHVRRVGLKHATTVYGLFAINDSSVSFR